MDSLSTQKAKPRKMKVVVKKSRAQVLLDLFYRVIEITLVIITLAKLCYQLVITVESSGLASFLINRHLAFVLGNTIVITIVVKCGFFANQETDARRNRNDFYDEFVRESSRGERRLHTDVICREKQSEVESVAKQSIEENRAKQSIEDKRQSRAKPSMSENRAKQSTEEKREKLKKSEISGRQSSGDESEKKDITVKKQRQIVAQNQDSPMKSYERSRSENHEGSKKSSCVQLKRSETERPADRIVSDDELRYKIESFIARQRRNQKDEEFCII
ncbi:hypothetical protein AtNW77_Chr2g0239831 [Arabidopsis thaliana]|uniref:Nucleolar-like protein n=4 Tax=Arabidopsis TaxID=3701 RepID=Q9SIK3_ARATH|nr:nucleolar-like protein [Arabidopsis thaliana]KAG7636963.1 hypothetical protein ISN45_At02g015370 [Arabidopsis thaliana x Arabidopsis arenosa]KAG7641582.1 hypothetical protein ISN44_As02g015860 [Arabidopsis suecica]AAD23648.1 unknown protein [Arabidopsis thaliana]AEC07196.1 nucleolar-like protein [Arabidopsis thaliana]OAP07960.1 hypothetical protein AXX17_AT2G17090 [Arabidopsis thaliana]|eukprot:NP_179751.1 nucleolar-like protein [Arabidopsis thaliana]